MEKNEEKKIKISELSNGDREILSNIEKKILELLELYPSKSHKKGEPSLAIHR